MGGPGIFAPCGIFPISASVRPQLHNFVPQCVKDVVGFPVPPGALRWRYTVTDAQAQPAVPFPVRIDFLDDSGQYVGSGTIGIPSPPGPGPTSDWQTFNLASAQFNVIICSAGSGVGDYSQVAFNMEFEGDCVYCAYGTEPKSGALQTIELTGSSIAGILALTGQEELAIPLGVFVGYLLTTGTLCAGPPLPMPLFSACDFDVRCNFTTTDPVAKFWTLLQILAWFSFCQCKAAPAGQPPPTAFPPPPSPLPPGTPPPPVPQPISCDGSDLCTVINQIQQTLNIINNNVMTTRTDVTLIQRQSVPFAYVQGVSHPDLTGTGQFAVLDILGLSVKCSEIPPGLGGNRAPIESWYRLGEISLGARDGWLRRQVITHNPHMIREIEGDITQVAYLFEPGVTCTIVELVRAP